MAITIESLAGTLHKAAVEKGFYDSLDMREFNSQAKQLAMIHSEVTEVLEALRKDKGQDAVLDELADILIRVFDFYGALVAADVIDDDHYLEKALNDKIAVNKGRPKMHNVRG